ncbi:protein ABCI12, chloroplastic [Phalaenopsis equestris]|uniref:protein ABCI12, chloroplastic n=1 Tax=Phalaenopsis equestris TaxID=78828 RepID=UPI0009E50721|nr:protein ABCI12, chloroplastic [Phalaenopsis equestris]
MSFDEQRHLLGPLEEVTVIQLMSCDQETHADFRSSNLQGSEGWSQSSGEEESGGNLQEEQRQKSSGGWESVGRKGRRLGEGGGGSDCWNWQRRPGVWLLALVLLPARSHIYMRIGLVIYLSFLSVLALPAQIWMDQMGRVAFLSGVLFVMLGFGSDSILPTVQLRTPPPSMIGLPDIPKSLEGYSYLIMKLGPLQLTRKGLSVASTSACLTFTIFQSASLCLATTTPEQLASALWWFMYPLSCLGVSVDEVILTLLLSLRFINIVFDEVRNTALGIVARRIYWQKLTFLETLDGIFFFFWLM